MKIKNNQEVKLINHHKLEEAFLTLVKIHLYQLHHIYTNIKYKKKKIHKILNITKV